MSPVFSPRLVVLGLALTCVAPGQIDPSVWRTDVSRKSIELQELHLSAAKDQIRALDEPRFTSVDQSARKLDPREPVIVFRTGDIARAYPVRVLLFHEIVNDVVADTPIAVTFCPLCNTGLVFDRRVDGRLHEFAVAGFLRKSDMVMYDRETESLWQQATGEALVGEHTGKRLKLLAGATVPFKTFREAHPEGTVLSLDTGAFFPYGISHYSRYEFTDQRKHVLETDRIGPRERVLAIQIEDQTIAYPLRYLSRWGTAEGKLVGRRYVVLYESSMLSAMDAEYLRDSRSIGSAAAFSPFVNGKRLRFRHDKSGRILDKQTGSRWTVLGRCIEGPLVGTQLEPIRSTVAFAFAWFDFYPKTRLMGIDPLTTEIAPNSTAP